MKIAVVTDSNSGITQKKAAEMGISVVPMPFMIEEDTFFEDINLTQEEFYKRLGEDADISTAQPSPGDVMELWDKLLKENDQIVHIPMSSGLSGSCETALMLSSEEKYENRVFVVNNQRISVTQEQSVRDALMLIRKGLDGDQVRTRLEEAKFNSVIYITVDTLKYLKKGGRITPAAAALGTLLRLKPVLTILGEKLDAYAKARTTKQAKSIMMTALAKDLETKLGDAECRHTHLAVAHTSNEEAAAELAQELKSLYPRADINIAPLSLSVACHIGPGSLAIAATGKMEEEMEDESTDSSGVLS